jgi:phosphopantothenoylcysteine decarboxylase / phosphopantothenate---cysteine ligase
MDDPTTDNYVAGVPDSAEGNVLERRHVIVGVTGSIAAYKAAELVRLLKKAGAAVQIVMTPDAQRFVTPLTLGTLSEREVLVDLFPENEQGGWTRHVQLGLWAHLLVVAPATATTIAKLASGVCDSMLTATALSRRCPMLVCPAMDHDMFRHPATQRNIGTLREDGVEVMEPGYGSLASGLVGDGRLPEPEEIFDRIVSRIGRGAPAGAPASGDLAGRSVLVTAGPTREALDPVRFVSNASTGTMGFALAEEAASRGADVVLVAGPTNLPTPAGVRRVDVVSAQDMYGAAMEHSGADLVFGVAAVADYRPVEVSERKVKKGEGDVTVEFTRTPDIIAAIGAQKRLGQTVVGFALETHDGEENARQKLQTKNLDWVVLNRANEEGSGFGEGTNRVTVFGREGESVAFPRMPKRAVAGRLLDMVTAGNARRSI